MDYQTTSEQEAVLFDIPIAKIEARVASKKFYVLIDTCSSVNLISQAVLEQLPRAWKSRYEARSELSQSVLLTAFDGDTRVAPDGHVMLPVVIGNLPSTDILFLVTRTTSHPILLGTNAINLLRLVVDRANGKLLSLSTGESIPLLSETGQYSLPTNQCLDIPLFVIESSIIEPWTEMVVPAAAPIDSMLAHLPSVAVEIAAHPEAISAAGIFAARGFANLQKRAVNVVVSNMSGRAVTLNMEDPLSVWPRYCHPMLPSRSL
ncbi:hypothetical protein BVRB_020000 [Beta vulgaris subsp. vulgaris]|uniref:Uncharacterized protein n=1 Tax=Beta vulgaris subsp. vulgaris TaxID=3555 RepID=A0A0J8B408_BETVV|nr:hypothetical protein BVRB_020000 [Beta vulgaris subsp. vulgaris]